MTATVAGPRTQAGAGLAADAGAARLLRFALRRDRVRITVWALSLGGLVAYFVVALPRVYPDAAARQTRAAIMAEPSGAFLGGPRYGLEDYTLGVMVANELVGMLAVAAALMSIFLVVRHTRAEEESGRADLVRAGAVGRRAPLTAALGDVLVANLVVGTAVVLALLRAGLAAPDSAAAGAGIALVGGVFGALAGVTSQLARHARAASGAAGALLGLAYVLRGLGDAREVGGSALSWASPVGWVQQSRAFVDLRWWPLALCAALGLALTGLAYALVHRRDVGAGLLATRAGRTHARGALVSPFGLAVRLGRGGLLGWAAGLGAFGLLTGSLAQSEVASFEARPELAELVGGGGGDLARATVSAFLSFFAMGVVVHAVVAVHHLRREEGGGRASGVLASGASRSAWLGQHLLAALAGSVLLLLVTGLALGVGAAASLGDPGLVGELTLASLAYVPVLACFAGLAVLAYGLGAPAWGVWVVLVASILVGVYGPLLDLPRAVLDAAPFGLVPAVPDAPLDVAPLAAMTVVALALTVAGAAAFRRRDLVA
ncbi:ABC transporter permease [Cellulomonas sp. NPDC055163]